VRLGMELRAEVFQIVERGEQDPRAKSDVFAN
jgi:hypothetical protein